MQACCICAQDLATHTRVTPAARQASLVKLSQSLNRTPAAKAELDKWGLMIDEKLMEVCFVLLRQLKKGKGFGLFFQPRSPHEPTQVNFVQKMIRLECGLENKLVLNVSSEYNLAGVSVVMT